MSTNTLFSTLKIMPCVFIKYKLPSHFSTAARVRAHQMGPKPIFEAACGTLLFDSRSSSPANFRLFFLVTTFANRLFHTFYLRYVFML